MKTNISIMTLAAAAMMLTFVSCRSAKIVLNDPCEGKEYFTDDEYYRAKGIGESIDKATARTKGRLEASSELGKEIKNYVFEVTNRFTEEYAKNWDKSLMGKFLSWVEQSIELTLADNYLVCEKTLQDRNTNYIEFHCVLQTARQTYLDNLQGKITNDKSITEDERQRISYDFEQYRNMYRERKKQYDERLNEMLKK